MGSDSLVEKCIVQILSRAKPTTTKDQSLAEKEGSKGKELPKLEDFLTRRDYTGAIAILEFEKHTGKANDTTDMWLAYCAFHLGDYKRSMDVSRQSGFFLLRHSQA